MFLHPRTRPRPILDFDQFEPRLVLSVAPTSLSIPLDPKLDQFGAQIETIQAYGNPSQATVGIFDTGSSVVSVSANDRATVKPNGAAIPVKVPGGAQAGGIGGGVTGDVSQPGTIWADGIHASRLSFDRFGNPSLVTSLGPNSAQAPSVQAFLGTNSGSPALPTVTGTPILNPSLGHPSGLAAKVDFQGFQLNLSSLFPGLVLAEPDLHFVAPNTTLIGSSGTTAPVRIPVSFVGTDNHNNPGDQVTASPNPVVQNVTLAGPTGVVGQQSFLFDTGSQMTTVSTAEAKALGLDLAHPNSTITVQGVGGTEQVPGFTLPSLTVPLTNGGTLQFTDVPVYVLDAAPGVVDGILGMNLLNNASQMLYDPFDPSGPSLSLTFDTTPNHSLGGGSALFTLLAGQGTTPTGSDGTGPSAAPGTVAGASKGGDPRLLAAGAVGQQVLVMVPNEAGSGLGQPAIDARSGPATGAVPTPQSPSAAAVPPAQSVSSAQATADRPIAVADDDLALRFEDATFDAPLPGSAPMLDPGTAPIAPTDGPGMGAPAVAVLSGRACDLCLAEEDWAGTLTDVVARPSMALAEGAGLGVLPAGTAVGLAAVLGGYWATPTEDLDAPRRRRSAIRIRLDAI